MPSVPYSGTPSVAPEDQPIPYRQVSTPIDAFGGAVAQAVSHLGQVQESAGTELFQRGYAMQELNQRAQAIDATAKFTTDMGQKYADFTSLEGKNAVDGFKPFLDDINKTRDSYRQGLTSPYAQQQYDADTRNQQSRFTMSAAGHAGTQNKAYVLGSSKARVAAAGDQAMAIPGDDDAFKSNLATVETEANHQADIQGLSSDARQQLVSDQKSGLISQRIQGMAKSQPYAAQKLLDQYSKSGDLQGQDSARLSDYVQKQRWGVASRNEASAVMAGNDTHFGAGVVEPDRAADAIRGIESNGNYGIVHPPAKNGDHALGAYGIMANNLAPWLKEAGMSSMTEQEFVQNKAAQDELFQFKFGQYQKQYGSFNAAANVWFTGKPDPNPNASDGGTTAAGYLVKANAQLAQNASLKQLTDAGRARAEELAPGDSVFGDYVTSHIEQLHNDQVKIQRDQEFDNRQTIEGALVSGMQNGQIPTSVADLKTDPKVEAAWDGMQSSDQRKYLNILAHNAKGDVAMTEPRLAQYQKLVGESISDPDQFLKEDIVGADLPMSTKKELINKQAQVYKKADASPLTSRALGVLGPQLQAAGVTKDDKDGYAQFAGALHDELEQYQQDNKKPAQDKDIQLIGSRLLQKFGGGWLSSGTPMFQTEVPGEARDAIMADPEWQRQGITPSDDMVQRIYVRKQFQSLYGKKTSQPDVPIR